MEVLVSAPLASSAALPFLEQLSVLCHKYKGPWHKNPVPLQLALLLSDRKTSLSPCLADAVKDAALRGNDRDLQLSAVQALPKAVPDPQELRAFVQNALSIVNDQEVELKLRQLLWQVSAIGSVQLAPPTNGTFACSSMPTNSQASDFQQVAASSTRGSSEELVADF